MNLNRKSAYNRQQDIITRQLRIYESTVDKQYSNAVDPGNITRLKEIQVVYAA